jgi:hypothetical protein
LSHFPKIFQFSGRASSLGRRTTTDTLGQKPSRVGTVLILLSHLVVQGGAPITARSPTLKVGAIPFFAPTLPVGPYADFRTVLPLSRYRASKLYSNFQRSFLEFGVPPFNRIALPVPVPFQTRLTYFHSGYVEGVLQINQSKARSILSTALTLYTSCVT